MIDSNRIKGTFLALTEIDSPSLDERKMADYVKDRFEKIGITLIEDDSCGKINGTAGNLYAYVEGDVQKEPILLSAHLDTVAPAYGKKAIVHPNGRITSDGTTVLGSDDLAGVTSILEAVTYIKEYKIPHRSFEILFTAGEELYCKGAAAFDYSKVRSKAAYVLDLSGPIGEAAYAAPSIISFQVMIHGKASHAGFQPEAGIHAMQAGCSAVARLKLGRIDEETTANVGIFKSGEGTNIIPEWCHASGEVRSLKHEKAMFQIQKIREVFEEEAKKLGAEVTWKQEIHIEAYETPIDSIVVQEYASACKELGITSTFVKTFGGSDNNVFARQGIKGLVVTTAMNQVHSCEEYTELAEMTRSAEIVAALLRR